MAHIIRVVIIVAIVGFALFFLVNQPVSAGDHVQAFFAFIAKFIEAVIVFFQTLTS